MLVEFRAIADRICYSRQHGKYGKINIVRGHAPINEILKNIQRYDKKIHPRRFKHKSRNKKTVSKHFFQAPSSFRRLEIIKATLT